MTCGCRPGELARATRRDWMGGKLTLRTRKGGKVRPYNPYVSTNVRGVIEAAAAGKGVADLLFVKADGKPWDRSAWYDRWTRAVAAANARGAAIPDELRHLYAVRHYAISALLAAGEAPLAVAKRCGTSIRKAFGRLFTCRVPGAGCRVPGAGMRYP